MGGSRPPYLPVEARPDVLVFETTPLAEDVEVTGVIEPNFWISSDGPDSDFTIKLIDVYPPCEDYPEGFAFKRGHRIRLDNSSSNFPHFDVNPGTGAAEGRGLTRRVARNTVFADLDRPSHVVLPLISRRPGTDAA